VTKYKDYGFVIQRSVVSLKVQLEPNSIVSIKLHNWKEPKLRLWRIIVPKANSLCTNLIRRQ